MVSELLENVFEDLGVLWTGFLEFIPSLIVALIVFIIGWFIALAIGRVVSEILIRIRFNELFERTDWKQALDKAKLTVNPAEFLGAIVKWILVIVVLMITVEILGLTEFATFLREDVVGYLPSVFIAALIFVVAVIVTDIVEKIVVATVEKMKVNYSRFAGKMAKWSIWIIAIFAIISELQIAEKISGTLFTGLMAFFVIAGGLAFGLGGKEIAADILRDLREKIKE